MSDSLPGGVLCQYFVQLELQDAVQPLQPFRVDGEHGVAGKAECPQRPKA